MLVPLIFLFFVSVAINKGFMYFLYYENFWGLLLTIASLVLSTSSAKNTDSKWHSWAVVTTELASVFNIIITFAFWAYAAPIMQEDDEVSESL
jgi:hypothetical protein